MAAPMKTLDQQRAAFAWKCALERGAQDTYVNLAKGAPALVMGNGLMQALAFYEQKSDDSRALGRHLREWLDVHWKRGACGSFAATMSALHGASGLEYLRASEESLEVLRWIRQLAAAHKKASAAKEARG